MSIAEVKVVIVAGICYAWEGVYGFWAVQGFTWADGCLSAQDVSSCALPCCSEAGLLKTPFSKHFASLLWVEFCQLKTPGWQAKARCGKHAFFSFPLPVCVDPEVAQAPAVVGGPNLHLPFELQTKCHYALSDVPIFRKKKKRAPTPQGLPLEQLRANKNSTSSFVSVFMSGGYSPQSPQEHNWVPQYLCNSFSSLNSLCLKHLVRVLFPHWAQEGERENGPGAWACAVSGTCKHITALEWQAVPAGPSGWVSFPAGRH